MAQGESKLSRKIIDALTKRGAFAFKVHGGPWMMAGLPDIIVCVDGAFVGLETKTDRGRVSAVQELVHSKIREAGGRVYVVHSVAEAVRVVFGREL